MLLEKKHILIVGGTGTVGQELTKLILGGSYGQPEEIVIYSRSEISQVAMREKFKNKKLRFIIGDVRDRDALSEVCRGIDIIYYLAAIKHVSICENQPQEALKTNCMGATNMIKAAQRNNVKTVVNMSSDKAVNPSCFYGHTKAIAERLFNNANGHGNTAFINIRSGNVMGSSGSVIPLFINQIKQNNKVEITNPAMTRYFISVADIAELLIKVSLNGLARHIYIAPDRQSFLLGELAQVLIKKYGKSDTKIVNTGMREGEKVHEQLFNNNETVYTLDSQNQTLSLTNLSESSEDTLTNTTELSKWLEKNGI